MPSRIPRAYIATIGHSTLTKEAFGQVLERADRRINRLIDVRSHPESSNYPHFNQAQMLKWVPKSLGMEYDWWPELGGWGPPDVAYKARMEKKGVDVAAYSQEKFPKHIIARTRTTRAGVWQNQGLYDYAWFTAIHRFNAGIERLLREARQEPVVIMCAESLWWKCHRSMIADRLVYDSLDHAVVHLQPKPTEHKGDMAFKRIARYPAPVRAAWAKGGI